jgi:hypothetical protein
MNGPASTSELTSAIELKGRPVPWGFAFSFALAIFVALGFWLRLNDLAAEGFADDELHKWLAANRYLLGDFGGDDLEHPMLMKLLIAATVLAGRKLHWMPETITRLPNAIAAGLSVVVLAFLGRRLFGRAGGFFAAAIGAVSVTWIGYQRIAKEDVLLCLFFMVLCLCLAEAKAAADAGESRRARRFEVAGAAALGVMLASKYFFHLVFIPPLVVWWIGRTQTAYRVPVRRWLELVAVSAAVWLCLNWMIALPSTLKYIVNYVGGAKHGGRATHMTMLFMGQLYPNTFQSSFFGMPPWFFAVFAAVKQTPGVLLLALLGLAGAIWQRRPAQRLVLAWMGAWFVLHALSGAKYARMFLTVYPAFFLLAGAAAAWLVERARASRGVLASGAAAALLMGVTVGPELSASLSHAPHYRTYLSPLAGGEAKLPWFFPHCDYFDAGFREAMQYLAAHAEPNAEVSTEIDWTASYYAERFGRHDLTFSMVRPGEACRQNRPCYVVIQVGRLYEANQKALDWLSRRPPWYSVRLRDVDVVKIYRLTPGETFPDASASTAL